MCSSAGRAAWSAPGPSSTLSRCVIGAGGRGIGKGLRHLQGYKHSTRGRRKKLPGTVQPELRAAGQKPHGNPTMWCKGRARAALQPVCGYLVYRALSLPGPRVSFLHLPSSPGGLERSRASGQTGPDAGSWTRACCIGNNQVLALASSPGRAGDRRGSWLRRGEDGRSGSATPANGFSAFPRRSGAIRTGKQSW